MPSFLSDLCGREGLSRWRQIDPLFLSDLCGREGFILESLGNDVFLSDLCGREVQKHDVILCRVGRTHHVNHALIYLGDGNLTSEKAPKVIGDNLVLHHPHGRLSVREIYGESWQKRTAMVVRHQVIIPS